MSETPPRYRPDFDDIGIVVAGTCIALLSFVPWYRAEGDVTFRLRAWDLGLTAILGVLSAGYAAGRVVMLRGRPAKPGVPVTPAAETFVASVVALLLLAYRVLDVPTVEGVAGARTTALVAAATAVVLQAVFAARKLGRTGLRA